MDNETCGFTVYWRIENFDIEPPDDFSIKSQVFKVYSMNANWEIEIMEENGCLGAYLFKVTNTASFPVHYSLSLLTGSGWITVSENEKKRFRAGGDGFGDDDIVDLKKLKKDPWFYLPNGSLTISFRIWNDRIKGESCQRVMISRLIDGDYLRHRPIQTFSTLKPSDLFTFPHSYEFQSNSLATFDCQKAKEVKTQRTLKPSDWLAVPHSYEIPSNSLATLDCQKAKEVKTQHTQTDTRDNFKDLDRQEAKEVKMQHTQTDTYYNFKDLDDLRKLFQEKEFSFVTFRTPAKEFSVHKAVLCAKSPVFNAMFERKMKENDCNVVEIDDIDSQTMALFVKFLHFDPLDDLKWSSAVSLYYAADKYQIDLLKEQCVSLLKKELSVENVCEVLHLADLHQNSDLMNYAQEYFCKNSKAIFLSTPWKEMLGHTELVAHLLCKLAETMH